MFLNIFANIGISFLFTVFVFCVFGLVAVLNDSVSNRVCWVATAIICLFFVSTVLINIEVASNSCRIYADKFVTQRSTIEQSLKSENLSGFEKVELVNKAVELNGELAERKSKLNRWYNVIWDKSVYDDIEYIKFE